MEQLARDGFIAFEGLLSNAEVEQGRGALAELAGRMHHLYVENSPEVKSSDKRGAGHSYSGVFVTMTDRPFGIQFEEGVDPRRLESSEAELHIRKLMYYHAEHRFLDNLVTHPKISGILESILGPGAVLFQDMALVKNPGIGVAKPWHQDNAYFAYAPLEQIIGVWIALDDVSVENGCMHFLPGAHRNGALKHFHGTDCEIVAGRIDPSRAVPVELSAGGAVFFYGMAPHYTPPNSSSSRRRALQYHYRGRDTQKLELDDYDRLFAEADGTPASCRAAAG